MVKDTMMELDKALDESLDMLVKYCMSSSEIDRKLYYEYDVKRGLRDANGKGVLTGLTEVSDITSSVYENGVQVPSDGKLYYYGYDVEDLLAGRTELYRFEEVTYLLLFGQLPTKNQLDAFIDIITDIQELSGQFVRDVIMKSPSENIMNSLQKSIITLYSFDPSPEDISIRNVLRQSLQMIAKMPLISVYAYHAYQHFEMGGSLLIRNPDPKLCTAENILRLLRPDSPGFGYCAGPSCGAWRRKQFHLHHPCGDIIQDGYIFCHCGRNSIA